jgi:hypothetical protein
LSGEPTLEELLEVQAYFRLPSLALVEKDFYVLRALAAIAAVETQDLHLRLVFGGGTALSRAHRLIPGCRRTSIYGSSATATGRAAGHCAGWARG